MFFVFAIDNAAASSPRLFPSFVGDWWQKKKEVLHKNEYRENQIVDDVRLNVENRKLGSHSGQSRKTPVVYH